MSYMYYDVLKVIKGKYKNEFGRSKEETKLMIRYFISAFSALFIPILLSLFKDTSFVLKVKELKIYSPIIIVIILLGSTIAIKSLIKMTKISKKHNTREHVLEVKTALESIGIDNIKKADMLKNEILTQNQKEDDLQKELTNMISGIFKTTLIVPIGFLFGMFFQNTETVSLDDIIQLSVLLLLLSTMFVVIVLQGYPYVKRVFFYSRKDRETVYKYLCDIEYLDE